MHYLDFISGKVSRCGYGQPQPSNPFQDSCGDLSRDRHPRHLEGHVPCMRDDLRADPD